MNKFIFSLLLSTIPFLLPAQDILTIKPGGILSLKNGAILTVEGSVNLANGSQLVNNGTITLGASHSTGTAVFTDNTSNAYNYGSGDLIFHFAGIQSIKSVNSFGRLVIDNTDLDLSGDLNVNHLLLRSGKINTHSSRVIVLSNEQGAVETDAENPGYSKSWVNGTIRRYITPAGFDHYDFPVGSADQGYALTLYNSTTAPLSGLSYLDAGFGAKEGSDAGLILNENGNPYTSINPAGVWFIQAGAAPAGQYALRLAIEGFKGLADDQFAILERPEGATTASAWTIPTGSSLPSAGSAGRTIASGYAQRNGLTSFGEFGIGVMSVPLPIRLLSFDAKRISRDIVQIDWETAQEQNNKGCEIERRVDTSNTFSDLSFVPSRANGGYSTEPLAYHSSDANAYPGITYYRLKQIDLDGTSAYSIIKAVSGTGDGKLSISLYPNPGHGQFSIRVNGGDKSYTAILADQLGRIVRQVTITGSSPTTIGNLTPGLYFIRLPDIFGKDRSFTEKILIVP